MIIIIALDYHHRVIHIINNVALLLALARTDWARTDSLTSAQRRVSVGVDVDAAVDANVDFDAAVGLSYAKLCAMCPCSSVGLNQDICDSTCKFHMHITWCYIASQSCKPTKIY